MRYRNIRKCQVLPWLWLTEGRQSICVAQHPLCYSSLAFFSVKHDESPPAFISQSQLTDSVIRHSLYCQWIQGFAINSATTVRAYREIRGDNRSRSRRDGRRRAGVRQCGCQVAGGFIGQHGHYPAYHNSWQLMSISRLFTTKHWELITEVCLYSIVISQLIDSINSYGNLDEKKPSRFPQDIWSCFSAEVGCY